MAAGLLPGGFFAFERNFSNRAEHADRHGKIFQWADPPKGGHPGQDFNCRCKAIQLTPTLLMRAKLNARMPNMDPNRFNKNRIRETVTERTSRVFNERMEKKIIQKRREWVRRANQALETVMAREEAAYIKELEDEGLSVPDYLRARSKRPTRDTIRLASTKETEVIAEKQFELNQEISSNLQKRVLSENEKYQIIEEKIIEHYDLQGYDKSKIKKAIEFLKEFGKNVFRTATDTLFVFPTLSLVEPEFFKGLDLLIKEVKDKYEAVGRFNGEWGENNPYYIPPFTEEPSDGKK